MYLILSNPSKQYGLDVSRELWRLSRPDSVNSNDGTQYYCSVIEHPSNGQVAIGPIAELHRIHPQADEERFASVIEAAVTSGERSAIKDEIANKKGGKAGLLGMIQASPSLSPRIKTKEQLEQAGWFPTPEE